MELRHLRYFLAVASTCHFGRAAQQLHIAQPALSQAVRQLESELGAALLVRTTRSARLTPAGELLQREARRLLEDLDGVVEDVRRVAAGQLGVLRLGVTGSAAVSHLPGLARAVGERLPGLELDVHADLLTPAQCEALRDGSLDLGVLRPPTTGEGIATRLVCRERLLLALPAEHRLVEAPRVSMADLREEPFVVFDKPSSAMNKATLRSCDAAGFAPSRTVRAPDTPVVLSLVAAGLGVALVPEGAARGGRDGVVVREVAGAVPVDLALAWRREDPPPIVTSVLAALEAAGFVAAAEEARP